MGPFARTIDAAKNYVGVEYPGPGRLERGARAWGSRKGGSAARAQRRVRDSSWEA